VQFATHSVPVDQRHSFSGRVNVSKHPMLVAYTPAFTLFQTNTACGMLGLPKRIQLRS